MNVFVEITILALCAVGAFFSFVAAFGVLRFPTALARLHCSTKAATLGVGFLMVGAAMFFGDSAVIMRALAIVVFLLLTAPISGHAIARCAVEDPDAEANGATTAVPPPAKPEHSPDAATAVAPQ